MRQFYLRYVRFADHRGVVVFGAVALVAVAVATAGRITLWGQLLVAILIGNWYVSRTLRSRKTFASVGLDGHHALWLFAAGTLGAAAFISIVVGIYAVAGWYEIVSVRFPVLDLAYWTVLFLAVAFAEELFARGWLFTAVARRWGVAAAVGATAAIFGLLHLPNANATAMSAIGIAIHAGLMFAGLLLVTRSLWAPIGAHFAWNLFEGPVWGFPVSGIDASVVVHARISGPKLWTGGAFGPEAGLVTILIGGAIGLALIYAAWRTDRLSWPPIEETTSVAPAASG